MTIRPLHALLLSLALTAAGCGGDNIFSRRQFLGGDGGDDMALADMSPVDGAVPADLTSPSLPPPPDLGRITSPRLRPRYVYHDGAVVGTVAGLYDTTLLTTCAPRMTKEGVVRCVPDGIVAEAGELPSLYEMYFSDNACTQPALATRVSIYGPKCLPATLSGKYLYLLTNPSDANCIKDERRIDQVLRVGGSVAAPVQAYRVDPSTGCTIAYNSDNKAHFDAGHKFWSLTEVPLRTLAEITEP